MLWPLVLNRLRKNALKKILAIVIIALIVILVRLLERL